MTPTTEANINLQKHFDLLIRATNLAQDVNESVYLTDDKDGVWSLHMQDEEGWPGAILLEVKPNGTFRLIDNTEAGNSEEPWRR